MRGVPDAALYLGAQHSAAGVQLSIISAMELVMGCRNAAELARLQAFLQHSTILDLTEISSRAAYMLVKSYFLSHGLLIPDALIAATALEHRLTLHTRNTRHFRMIPGLTVDRPY